MFCCSLTTRDDSTSMTYRQQRQTQHYPLQKLLDNWIYFSTAPWFLSLKDCGNILTATCIRQCYRLWERFDIIIHFFNHWSLMKTWSWNAVDCETVGEIHLMFTNNLVFHNNNLCASDQKSSLLDSNITHYSLFKFNKNIQYWRFQ